MKNLKFASKCFLSFQVVVLTFLLIPAIALAQNSSPLTGKYEGTAKAPSGDVKLTLDLVEEGGKFSGRVTTSANIYEVTKGELVDGLLSLELQGKATSGKLAVRQKDGKLVGSLSAHGETGTVELKKIEAEASMAEFLTGQWDGTADANGQPFPFLLTLKVDGDKVTGNSSSELGTSTISNGTWKDGKLVFVLESANGQIGMVATIVDGKLVGDFDMSGQMTGKWAAIKKKP